MTTLRKAITTFGPPLDFGPPLNFGPRLNTEQFSQGQTMSPTPERNFQVFDPKQEVAVLDRRLPHWSQAGTVCFITFRTSDSIPRPVLEAWLADRWRFLRQHGIDPMSDDWGGRLQQLAQSVQAEFHSTFSNRWHDSLDECHGECVLRRIEPSDIVASSLRHFDGDRYELTDFVVMPNHVHILAAFSDNDAMLAQCESWKHFTATQINRKLQRKGRFWQQDGFDHLVRSNDQFEFLRDYIASNPQRAKLGRDEFQHFSKDLKN